MHVAGLQLKSAAVTLSLISGTAGELFSEVWVKSTAISVTSFTCGLCVFFGRCEQLVLLCSFCPALQP